MTLWTNDSEVSAAEEVLTKYRRRWRDTGRFLDEVQHEFSIEGKIRI